MAHNLLPARLVDRRCPPLRGALVFGVGALVSLSCLVAGAQQPDSGKHVLRKSKVKAVTASVYRYPAGTRERDGGKAYARRWDERGNLIEEVVYSSVGGGVLSQKTIKYAGGRPVEVVRSHLLHWDEGTTVYSYDSNGRLVEAVMRRPNGAVEARERFTYDGGGEVAEDLWYQPRDFLAKRIRYSRDAHGRLIESLTTNAEGVVQTREVHTYGGAGSAKYPSETRVFSAAEHVATIVYRYDSRNRLIEKTYFRPDGALIKRVTTTYDANDLTVEELEANAAGQPTQLTTFAYEFWR